MSDSCVTWAVCGATSNGIKIYPYYKNWLFEAHSLWRDTLLSLDTGGRSLVLPQSDVTDSVDLPWESFPSGRVDGGWGGDKVRRVGGKAGGMRLI